MGEAADLRNAEAGTFGLNDFISQGDGNATITKLLRTMVPVVDMRDFQRRWRFSSGAQLLAIGEVISIRWQVPANENWKVTSVYWENGDNVQHSYSTFVTVNPTDMGDQGGLIGTYRPSLQLVSAAQSKVIYGLDSQERTNTDIYHQLLDLTLEPTDAFVVTMEEVAVGGGTQRWTLLYEIVPAPAVSRIRGIPAGRVIT